MSPIPTAGQSFRDCFVAVNAMLVSFTGELVVSNCIALQVDLQSALFAGINSFVIQFVQLNSDNDVNIAIFSNLSRVAALGTLLPILAASITAVSLSFSTTTKPFVCSEQTERFCRKPDLPAHLRLQHC